MRHPITAARASSGPASDFAGLASAKPTAQRNLFFSENDVDFFITVQGATLVVFDANNPPAIITHQGAVEDWTIENQTGEVHEFHQHQIHFLLLERNGVPVRPEQQQFLDTAQVDFWNGSGPFPSIKVRMDFRGMDVGDFVYHCHILEHEDGGMMAIIRVLPPSS
jgi:FtsP/CotA-like multicopper oxidase with cupredoxin domain